MSTVQVRSTNSLGIIVVCPVCPHQAGGLPVTSQEWTDTNGDVYFAASVTENANALSYFIRQHSAKSPQQKGKKMREMIAFTVIVRNAETGLERRIVMHGSSADEIHERVLATVGPDDSIEDIRWS